LKTSRISGIEVSLRDVESATADDVLWCDGLAVGSPTNMGILSWKMKRFWDAVMGPQWMKVAFYVDRRCDQPPLRKPEARMGAD
jgi:multimeric flavodoxin WrbA